MIVDPNNAVAKYLIQVSVTFKPDSMNVLGAFHLWKKGGLFGNADEMMKFCPAIGCSGFFGDSFEIPMMYMYKIDTNKDITEWPIEVQNLYEGWHRQKVICPECGTVTIREQLPDSYGFNMPTDRIAERTARFFAKLGGDADIFLVRAHDAGKFQKARSTLYDPMAGAGKSYEATLKEARKRDSVFYSLASIIKDTAGGSPLSSRFKALLEA